MCAEMGGKVGEMVLFLHAHMAGASNGSRAAQFA
jgi:hypothetical protein